MLGFNKTTVYSNFLLYSVHNLDYGICVQT
jgi:hypothetical protein